MTGPMHRIVAHRAGWCPNTTPPDLCGPPVPPCARLTLFKELFMSRFARKAATSLAAGAILLMGTAPGAGATTLKINGQAQENSNWCWAATGDSIASFFGKDVPQNTFCDLAFGNDTNQQCPNNQATLENDQQAFQALGINPGTATQVIDPDTVSADIDAGHPINTRIEWKSGGGHMMTIYGYDAASGALNYYNPWPDSDRYNTATYDWYVDNDQFSWTNSLYGIGGDNS